MNQIHQSLEKSLKVFRISRQSRLLLGISGGIDSMVMLHALHHLEYSLAVAHVNFQLRGLASDEDARLVQDWCTNHQVPFFLKEINTKKFAEQANLNTQLAARKIRYEWWEQLLEEHNFDFLATAHNLDDQMETFFINVLRGTGIKGLLGIPPGRNYFIRPMLSISRKEIEAYANEYRVSYRTDSSNLTDDYQRNRIRHHLMPMLADLSTGFASRMKHNLLRLQKEWNSWDYAYREWMGQHIVPLQDAFVIHGHAQQEGFLLRWLEEKGMPWNLAFDFIAAEGHSGHVLQKDGARLSRTATGFYFEKIKEAESLIVTHPGTYSTGDFIFTIYPGDPQKINMGDNPAEEFISSSVVTFPLFLRPVKPGDVFQPLGMHGHQKKLQDLLVDHKLDPHQKTRVRLLTNDHHILWVAGIQLDERAKIHPDDEAVYVVTLKNLSA